MRLGGFSQSLAIALLAEQVQASVALDLAPKWAASKKLLILRDDATASATVIV
jgi:hypothetical protein